MHHRVLSSVAPIKEENFLTGAGRCTVLFPQSWARTKSANVGWGKGPWPSSFPFFVLVFCFRFSFLFFLCVCVYVCFPFFCVCGEEKPLLFLVGFPCFFPQKQRLEGQGKPQAAFEDVPARPKWLQKMPSQKNCFGTITFAKLQWYRCSFP